MQLWNYIATGIVAILALWILYEAYREFVALRNDSHQLTHDLQVAGSVLEHVKHREEFADSFAVVNARLLDLEIFGPVWDEFRESLVVDAEERIVRSARDPYEFLGPRLLDASQVDQRRIEAVPNRLIAFGLIFTFLGLVASLIIAGMGLRTEDVREVRAVLNTLLIAAGLKFGTSIAGIASSIWFTSRRSKLLNKIDDRSAAIGRQLDRLTVPLRADIVAEASHKELLRQSQLLETGNEGLAQAIATQLDETLRANLASAIQPVADSIGRMSETIAEINRKALKDIVEQFSKELGGAARDHAKRLEESLYQLETTMKSVPESIQKASVAFDTAGAAFSEATEAAVAATELRLTQAGNALGELLTRTEENLSSAGLAFAQVADLLSGMVERIEQTETASSERARRAEETLGLAVEQISRVLERADTAVEVLAPLTPLAERLEQVAAALGRASELHAALIARGEELVGRSRAAGDTLSSTAAAYAERNEKLKESLEGVFDQLGTGIGMFQTRIRDTIDELDDNATRIVNRLQAAGYGRPAAPGEAGEAAE